MSKLVPIQLDNGMLLYIEAQDETETPSLPSPTLAPEPEEQTRGGQKGLPIKKPQISMEQSMHLVQNTIRTYAKYCMDSFQNLGNANLSEVTLEFGVNLSADAGIPYIASGKAQNYGEMHLSTSSRSRASGDYQRHARNAPRSGSRPSTR